MIHFKRPIDAASVCLVAAFTFGCAAPKESGDHGPRPSSDAAALSGRIYSVNIDVDPKTEIAHVRARLGGLRGAKLDLAFAERYAFVTLPPSLVGGLSATTEDGASQTLGSKNGFRFQSSAPVDGTVSLAWSIRLDARSSPDVISAHDHYEQSYVEPGHGMLFTAGLIPMPNVDLDRCEVTFSGVFGDSVRAPWPESQDRREPRKFLPSPATLADDIVLIGSAWQAVDADAGGMTATFAMSPGNERLAPLVTEVLVPIVKEEVRLFGAPPQERYLFVFGPSEGQPGLGGSPKSGAMTMYASENLDPRQVRGGVAHLVAHEFHHTFGRENFRTQDEIRFFNEGFTDYYAYLVPWRLGYIDDASFHRVLERKLSEGAAALASYGRSLAQAGGPEFFAGRDAYQACYSAGLALALWTDVGLRRAASPTSLDAVMVELHESLAATHPAKQDRGVGLDAMAKILLGPLRITQREAFTRAVTTADEVDWTALFDEVDLPLDRIVTAGAPDEYRVPPAVLDLIRKDA